MVEFRAVSKVYPPRAGGRAIPALTDLSFQIAPGELVVVSGPVGSGKSTLCRLVSGEERATRGTVLVGGEDVGALGRRALARLRRRLGVAPQDARLVPDRTVLGNLVLVLRARGASSRDARARALAALRESGLGGCASALPGELAAGDRQRLLLLRALVGEPELLMAGSSAMAFDGLDEPGARDLLELVCGASARGMTVLVATRWSALADRLKARVVRLEGGRVCAEGESGGAA